MLRVLVLAWVCLIVSLPSADAAKQSNKLVPDARNSQSAPPSVEAMVLLDGKPLFPIKVQVLSFSPTDRAKAVSVRINKLIKDPFFNTDSIKAIDGDTTSDIVAVDTLLMSITESDAIASGKQRTELAKDYVRILQTSITQRAQEYSTHSLALGAIYAVAASLVLLILFIALSRITPRIISKVESWKGTYVRSLQLTNRMENI